METFVQIRNLSRRFVSHPAVQQVSLDIQKGMIHAITGESGAGKSTLLRLIAGFEVPDDGAIRAGDRVLVDLAQKIILPPEKRRVGMVFQETALFPHLTVSQNIGYGVDRRERKERVRELLQLVHLEPYASRYPHEISGGQAQRVSLARALAPRPDLLLMDEPFNSLDWSLKQHLLPEIKRAIGSFGMTTIFVSHDRNEVFDLSDHISIMQAGRIIQTAEPRQIYAQPDSCYVAEFFGDANFLHRNDGSFMIRPEHIFFQPAGANKIPPAHTSTEAIILEKCYRGDHDEYWVEADALALGFSGVLVLQVRDYRLNGALSPGDGVASSSPATESGLRSEASVPATESGLRSEASVRISFHPKHLVRLKR